MGTVKLGSPVFFFFSFFYFFSGDVRRSVAGIARYGAAQRRARAVLSARPKVFCPPRRARPKVTPFWGARPKDAMDFHRVDSGRLSQRGGLGQ